MTKPQKIEGGMEEITQYICDDLICETGMEPDGKRLGITTTWELIAKLKPILEKRLTQQIEKAVASERQRCVDSLNQAKDGDYYTLSASKYRILKNNL